MTPRSIGQNGMERALIVVVAAGAGDGAAQKAVIEVLSATAAAQGDRVLTIEADLGGRSRGRSGLLDVLRGEKGLYTVVSTDAATGACWLGIGNGNRATRGTFDRAKVEAFLNEVGERFDLVLIDCGILSSNTRIGAVVGAADRLVVVARAGRTLQADLVDLDRVAAAMGRPAFGALLIDDRA